MKSPLENGLAALARHLGVGEELAHRVERVELDGDGGMVFAAEDGGTSRWFSYDDVLRELSPGDEETVPVAARMAELARGADWNVLSWRPGRRIAVAVERPGERRFVKGYRKGKSEAAARRLRTAAVDARSGDGFLIPTLIEHHREVDAIETGWIDGAPLGIGPLDTERFHQVGRGLRALQSGVSVEGLSRHGPDDETDLVLRLAARVLPATGGSPEGWNEVYLSLGTVDLEAPERTVACHRDLHDGQLLVTECGIALLDFDLLCAADPALDVANLVAHLELRALQGIRDATGESADSCSRALLEGLGGHEVPGFLRSFRFYQASAFLRLALVYSLRPRWAGLASPLTRLAERCLDELPGA